jgi:putative transport protein
MRSMTQLLVDYPLLLLFVVAGIGFFLGRFKVAGFSLGSAAVLFTGIAFNAWDDRLQIPEVISFLGLSLFIYTLGLSSGPAFSASLRHNGVRDNVFVLAMICVALGLTYGIQVAFDMSSPLAAGLFSGALGSTSSLAGVVDQLKDMARRGAVSPTASLERMLAEPVVGYTVAYPASVLGTLGMLFAASRIWKPDFAKEAKRLRYLGASPEELVTRNVRVTQPEATVEPLIQIARRNAWRVNFGRARHGTRVTLPDEVTTLKLGDEVVLVGAVEDMDEVVRFIGEEVPDTISPDRTEYDIRRMFVSRPRISGKRIKDLDMFGKFGARITRIRRGDLDLLPTSDTHLELGDRVRVIARRERMKEIAEYFGDSYKAISEIDIAVLSVGMALGVLLGVLPIPLPDGSTFRLGYAGGPLLVGLILGMVPRSGPFFWHLPYGANLTLRQLGIILFLAGVGTASGSEFAHTLMAGDRQGWTLLAGGLIVACVTNAMTLVIGYKLLRIPLSLLMGLLAGLQTQSTAVSFSTEQTGNEIPNVGYASVYTAATISKILLAQLLLTLWH